MLFHGRKRHLDTNDFRRTIDRLRAEYGKHPPVPVPGLPNVDNVVGMRLNCVGDKEMYRRNLIEPAYCPLDYVVATERRTLDLGDKLSISIMFSYFPFAPAWCGPDRNKHPGRPAINPVLTVLKPKLYWAGSGSVFSCSEGRQTTLSCSRRGVDCVYRRAIEKNRRTWGDYRYV
jgi:hypothetical protein